MWLCSYNLAWQWLYWMSIVIITHHKSLSTRVNKSSCRGAVSVSGGGCVVVCVCACVCESGRSCGNIVTMDWWDDLWLNEGFASFFEYVGVEKAEPDWGMVSFHHSRSSACLNR